jgi:hypothetical protein
MSFFLIVGGLLTVEVGPRAGPLGGGVCAYCADRSEDAYIVVAEDKDVIKVTGRYGRDLWSNADLPRSIG